MRNVKENPQAKPQDNSSMPLISAADKRQIIEGINEECEFQNTLDELKQALDCRPRPEGLITAQVKRLSRLIPDDGGKAWELKTATAIEVAIGKLKNSLSPSSLKTYETDWRNFAKVHSIMPTTPQPIRDYIYDYTNPRTRAKIHSELTQLYQCQEPGISNIISEVARPPRIESLPVHHSEEESRAILAAARTKNEIALANLIEVLGLRISEASSMDVADVWPESIKFRGKTFRGKSADRELWPPDAVMRVIRALANGRNPGEPLFVGQRGRLKAGGLRHVYELISQRAGIPKGRRHPHSGRHSAGTHLIEAGCDQFTVQKLLGHTRLDMTQHYVHLADGKGAKDRLERYAITATGGKTPDTRTSYPRHTFSACPS